MSDSWNARTKRELIIEVWEALDCESVGQTELERIQRVLEERFGEGGVESPAAIARVVAEEGAVLRHPEVLACDRSWRETKMSANGRLDFSSLAAALESFSELELQRRQLDEQTKTSAWQQLSDAVTNARNDVVIIARSRIVAESQRAEAKEIAEWLRVWLVGPAMFHDWLELRMGSADFQKKFGNARQE